MSSFKHCIVKFAQREFWNSYHNDWRVCHWLQCKEDLRVPSNIPFTNLTFWNYLTFESLMAIFAPFQPCILSFMEWKGQVLQRERRKIQHIFTIKCPLSENEVVVMTWKMFRFLASLFLPLPRGKKRHHSFLDVSFLSLILLHCALLLWAKKVIFENEQIKVYLHCLNLGKVLINHVKYLGSKYFFKNLFRKKKIKVK